MVPSTGYLRVFELRLYSPGTSGLILRLPEKEEPAKLPKPVSQNKLAKAFREVEHWARILGCRYVSDLNECISSGAMRELFWIAEGLHEKKIAHIADSISENRRELRLILVARPSSSGKTTFAQRLKVQLRVNGLLPMPISLDDYFVDRDKALLDEQGEFDFEALEAIDLFNNHLTKLLNGEAVELPTYNFITGKREFRGNIVKVSQEQPLIIEGIHGLNERLTSAIDRDLKVKICKCFDPASN